jgi:hypothetical protein
MRAARRVGAWLLKAEFNGVWMIAGPSQKACRAAPGIQESPETKAASASPGLGPLLWANEGSPARWRLLVPSHFGFLPVSFSTTLLTIESGFAITPKTTMHFGHVATYPCTNGPFTGLPTGPVCRFTFVITCPQLVAFAP